MLTLNVPDEGYTRNELCVLNCISPSLFKLFVVALHVQKEAKNPSAYGASRHFQQYLSYIMAVSCIGGGSHRHAAGH